MNLLSYKKVTTSRLVSELARELSLNYSQQDRLSNFINSNYLVVEFTKKQKSNIFIRLTAPFFILFLILVFLLMPLRWLTKGKASYEYSGWVIRTVGKWKSLLNF